MGGLQDVIFAKIYALGMKKFLLTILLKPPKAWTNDLDSKSLDWDDKKMGGKAKRSALRRIKPWMWKRNIKSMLKTNVMNKLLIKFLCFFVFSTWAFTAKEIKALVSVTTFLQIKI